MARWPRFLTFRRLWRRRGSRLTEDTAGKGKRFNGVRGFFGEQSLRLLRWGITLLMLVVLFLLARPSGSGYLGDLKEGSIPPRDIKAAFSFEYEDVDATQANRAKEAARVPPVYQLSSNVIDETSVAYNALVSRIKEPEEDPADQVALRKWIVSLEEALGISLPNRQYTTVSSATETGSAGTWSTLVEYRRYRTFWSTLGTLIDDQLNIGIVNDLSPIEKSKADSERILRDGREIGIFVRKPDGSESLWLNTNNLLTLSDFYLSVSETLHKNYFQGDDLAALRELADDILRAVVTKPTHVYSKEETQARREEVRAGVDPVMLSVYEGMLLVTDGIPITPREAMILDAYRYLIGLSWVSESGLFILALVTTMVIIAYLRRYHPSLSHNPRRLSVVLLIFVLILALARIASYLARWTPNLENVGFAVPIGAMGVLITLLASGRLAAFLVAMGSVYTGLILGGDALQFDLRFTIVALWSGFSAILAVHQVRQRSDLYRAGFLVAVMSVLAILALRLLEVQDFDQLRRGAEQLWFTLAWGGVNGALVFMLSIATLPLFEDLLGVTTDIKLLELGQKTPLLQRLEREAPGSYQHSMMVATLAESAAEAIGANALLTRVGAYYHDVGKMIKPAYFSENQQTAADKSRHAKIKPQMSVLVIRNHVKYGLELAREYKLPRVIQDFVPEHHGTTLIAYFYNQVLASSPPESVREEDFRYPGPKPRSKETAIVMLADSVEAVSRTLTAANEGEIRATVQKIINDRFFDGQLDECNLTLADLKKLVESFSDSLTHMLHQRIKYPPRPARRPAGTVAEAEEDRPLRRASRIGAA